MSTENAASAAKAVTRSESTSIEQVEDNLFEPEVVTAMNKLKKTDTTTVLLAVVQLQRELNQQLELKSERIAKLEQELSEKNDVIEMHEGRVTSLEIALENSNDKIIDLTARSMDKNLIVLGLTEDDKDDLQTQLTKFFTEHLKMPADKSVSIDICHRNGPRIRAPAGMQQPKPRAVTVMFQTRSDKNYVLSLRKNLPEKTKYGVVAQRPEEIRTSQSILFAQQKQLSFKTKVVGERLINETTKEVIRDLHKERHKAHDMDHEVAILAKKITAKRTGVVTHDESGSKFQGHLMKLDDETHLRAAFVSLKRDERVAKATHNAWALRLSDGRELMSDNYEFGAANKILEVLRAKDIKDRVCVVSRWYMGKHMGAERFQWYANAALEATKASHPDIP